MAEENEKLPKLVQIAIVGTWIIAGIIGGAMLQGWWDGRKAKDLEAKTEKRLEAEYRATVCVERLLSQARCEIQELEAKLADQEVRSQSVASAAPAVRN